MKNVMKTTVLALLVGMGASAAVSAAPATDEASGIFQWAGTVPAASSGANTKIVNKGTIALDKGTLVFQEDSATPGKYQLIDSTELIFGVEVASKAAASFDYEVENVKFSHGGGLMNDVDATTPEFDVSVDGTVLVKGTPVSNSSAADVRMRLTTAQSTNAVSGGEEVVVQAAILVTNAA
ncbi:hypothetical protein ACED66_22260 [Vibrio splendidus]|uniref:Uncharacterized protein n=1 Tax=Vibrio splendidus TaxID=29497 RepID=A0A0H3ZXG8_VIBSP|nr:hypothetical protein [Vibrio splendidus]AKN38151.1 hypothetical protein [Vibrio splendidus]PTP96474.1 hypothetical protein CWO28_22120 [Vibrio splendidus]